MQKYEKRFSVADFIVIGLIIAIIYALISYAKEWRAEFNPNIKINLSYYSLPYYMLFSGLRGIVAFIFSLLFSLSVGYLAAKSKLAEKIIIPLIDIFQSIPVLGFLPGLVLGLIALFPNTNMGLELASIIMIFTGQVWNMTLSFYSSIKSLPNDYNYVSRMVGLNKFEKFKLVELPFSAENLIWNCLMSISGGWFFLSVCEAFTLGDSSYRLPGLGSYMALAISAGNIKAMIGGISAMFILIIFMDIVIWRPIVVWAHQFRLDHTLSSSGYENTSFMMSLFKDSFILRAFTNLYKKRTLRKFIEDSHPKITKKQINPKRFKTPKTNHFWNIFGIIALTLLGGFIIFATIKISFFIISLPFFEWKKIFLGTFLTFCRVLCCLILGSLWTIPIGIWIGTSGKRIKFFQPIIQILASFPAPMIYPFILSVCFFLRIPFSLSSIFLMLFGAQWYILFNVLAGAMKIPIELKETANLMNVSKIDTWKKLYLPCIFPALVTGLVAAAGGAWNASIIAEHMYYKEKLYITDGLGSIISVAAYQANFGLLSASLITMIIFIVLLDRFVWAKVYEISRNQFRLELGR